MKKLITITLLSLFCITISGIEHADAKRFGMGSSFGKSFNKRATPAPRNTFQKKQAVPNSKAAGSPARGGMMGMLGGLALGGLLGAMFFGGGFEGINFFDILILGGIAFAIFWFMRRKAQGAVQDYAYANQYAGQQPEPQPTQSELFTSSEASPQTSGQMLRPDIDEAHFIPAAKDIFMRMQTAWDQKNMPDIRQFCSPDIANKVEQDLQQLGDHSTHTEVGMLNAEIADMWIEGNDEWVAVHFQAMLQEETRDLAGQSLENNTHEANETWIFRHPCHSEDPTWYVAGIQQAA